MNLFQMCNTNFLAFIFNCVNEMFPFCLCFRQSPISKWVDFLWHCSKHTMENNFSFVLLNFSPYAFWFPLWYLFISTNDCVVHWRMCFLLTVTFLLQVSSHFDNMTCFPCYHLSICTYTPVSLLRCHIFFLLGASGKTRGLFTINLFCLDYFRILGITGETILVKYWLFFSLFLLFPSCPLFLLHLLMSHIMKSLAKYIPFSFLDLSQINTFNVTLYINSWKNIVRVFTWWPWFCGQIGLL